MVPGRTRSATVHRVGAESSEEVRDSLLVEEPLEVHLNARLVATTMRTPGHDDELATGLLWSEGHLQAAPESIAVGPGSSAAAAEYNSLDVAAPDTGDTAEGRLGLASSSCGVCGAREVESLLDRLCPLPDPDPASGTGLEATELLSQLSSVESAIRSGQELFGLTGGCHAAAAVDSTGEVVVLREDIGRHNAVDKVVGHLLLGGSLPAARAAGPIGGDVPGSLWLWVSGRASFEVLQKAWAAGFVAVVAVGAVSALALEVARRANLTLVGFARSPSATLYRVARTPGARSDVSS